MQRPISASMTSRPWPFDIGPLFALPRLYVRCHRSCNGFDNRNSGNLSRLCVRSPSVRRYGNNITVEMVKTSSRGTSHGMAHAVEIYDAGINSPFTLTLVQSCWCLQASSRRVQNISIQQNVRRTSFFLQQELTVTFGRTPSRLPGLTPALSIDWPPCHYRACSLGLVTGHCLMNIMNIEHIEEEYRYVRQFS